MGFAVSADYSDEYRADARPLRDNRLLPELQRDQ